MDRRKYEPYVGTSVRISTKEELENIKKIKELIYRDRSSEKPQLQKLMNSVGDNRLGSIIDAAKRYSRKFKIDMDIALSESGAALMDAIYTYDFKRADFTTWFYIKASARIEGVLRDYKSSYSVSSEERLIPLEVLPKRKIKRSIDSLIKNRDTTYASTTCAPEELERVEEGLVERAFEELGEDYFDILRLHYSGLKDTQIAESRNCTKQNIQYLRAKALKKLALLAA